MDPTKRALALQPWFRGDYLIVLRDNRKLMLSRSYRSRLNLENLRRRPRLNSKSERLSLSIGAFDLSRPEVGFISSRIQPAGPVKSFNDVTETVTGWVI
jgi:hypothetical protein